jgi:hypothetical protein
MARCSRVFGSRDFDGIADHSGKEPSVRVNDKCGPMLFQIQPLEQFYIWGDRNSRFGLRPLVKNFSASGVCRYC